MSNEVKRITKASRSAIEYAVALMCDQMQMWEGFSCDGKIIADGKWGAKVAISYVLEGDTEASTDESYLFRSGNEFVCIPSMYLGEGSNFKGTEGNWYNINDMYELEAA